MVMTYRESAENELRILRAEVSEKIEVIRGNHPELLIASSLTWLIEERLEAFLHDELGGD